MARPRKSESEKKAVKKVYNQQYYMSRRVCGVFRDGDRIYVSKNGKQTELVMLLPSFLNRRTMKMFARLASGDEDVDLELIWKLMPVLPVETQEWAKRIVFRLKNCLKQETR